MRSPGVFLRSQACWVEAVRSMASWGGHGCISIQAAKVISVPEGNPSLNSSLCYVQRQHRTIQSRAGNTPRGCFKVDSVL